MINKIVSNLMKEYMYASMRNNYYLCTPMIWLTIAEFVLKSDFLEINGKCII